MDVEKLDLSDFHLQSSLVINIPSIYLV